MDFGLPVTMASSRMSGPLRSSPPRSCPETGPTRRAGSRCYTSILLEFPIFLYGLLHLLAATFGIIILQVRCCSHISYPVLQLAFSELQVFFLFNPRGGRTTYCWLRRNSSVYSWFDGYMVQVNLVFMILVSLFSLLPLQGSIFTSSPPSFPHDHHHV